MSVFRSSSGLVQNPLVVISNKNKVFPNLFLVTKSYLLFSYLFSMLFFCLSVLGFINCIKQDVKMSIFIFFSVTIISVIKYKFININITDDVKVDDFHSDGYIFAVEWMLLFLSVSLGFYSLVFTGDLFSAFVRLISIFFAGISLIPLSLIALRKAQNFL